MMKKPPESSPWQLLPSQYTQWFVSESKTFRVLCGSSDMESVMSAMIGHNALAETLYNHSLGLDISPVPRKQQEQAIKEFYIEAGLADGELSAKVLLAKFVAEAKTKLKELTGGHEI